MQPQTAKMIFPTEALAKQVLTKVNEKGDFTVVKLPVGWQVAAVTKLKPYMPPPIPAPVKKPAPLKVGTEAASGSEPSVTLEFQFKHESPAYLTVIHEGKEMHFGKGTLIAFEKTDDGQVKVKLPTKVAKKRGLV